MKIKYWLWLVLAGSVLLRVAAALYLGNQVVPLPGIFDQLSYHSLSIRVLEGHGFTFETAWWPMTRAGEPTAHWSYLYTLYLAAVYAVFGINPLVARLIQAVISGLAGPWLVYRLAMSSFQRRDPQFLTREFTARIALLAAVWFAFYGYFIYYAAALMTETFFILCILWSLDSALRIMKSGRLSLYIELGLACGMAVLFRQTYLAVVPIIILWLVWAGRKIGEHRYSWRSLLLGSLLIILILILMIAPITLYNFQRFGHFVLLNTNAGFAFFWANHPVHGINFEPLYTSEMPSYQEVIPIELRDLDEAALDKALMKIGIQYVTRDPVRFALLSLSRIPEHFLFWPLSKSSLPSNLTRVISIGLALPFMILGGWLWYSDVRKKSVVFETGLLLVLFICVYVGMHLLSWAAVRYRLPTDAVGLVFAARSLHELIWRLKLPLSKYVLI